MSLREDHYRVQRLALPWRKLSKLFKGRGIHTNQFFRCDQLSNVQDEKHARATIRSGGVRACDAKKAILTQNTESLWKILEPSLFLSKNQLTVLQQKSRQCVQLIQLKRAMNPAQAQYREGKHQEIEEGKKYWNQLAD